MHKRKKVQHSAGSEWRFVVEADAIGPEPCRYVLEASAAECEAISARIGRGARIEAARAEMTVRRQDSGHVIAVEGRVFARIVQPCVVTLEPVSSVIDEPFDGYFADRDKTIPFSGARNTLQAKHGRSEIPLLEERDDPEPLSGGYVDLGELAAQYLCLGVPEYPHANDPGEPVPGIAQEPAREASPLRRNPFQALENWRDSEKTEK